MGKHSWEGRVKRDRRNGAHCGEVVCKHRNILSQGANETTKHMKAKTEKGGVRGTEEGYKVGLTCLKNRQNTWIKTGGKNIIKTASAEFLLMFIFKYGYSVRHHSTAKGEETSLIKYCKGRGCICEKVRRILPTQVQTLKPACIVLYLRCWGEEM